MGTVSEMNGSLAAGRPLGLIVVAAIGVIGVIAVVVGYVRLRRRDRSRQ
jgi:hypothetical protein